MPPKPSMTTAPSIPALSNPAAASGPIPKHASGCAYGLVNLEPCSAIHLEPLASLGNYCSSMHTGYAQNGYDTYIAGVNPRMAMTMSGIPAAPPYEEEPCS
ncbi:hypothetical protein DL770_002695 [Monosporascus sp. CRB-9-2]|nr:hypothetical protein DL770_002695 [Monosporascus sp. CRB-9-2]